MYRQATYGYRILSSSHLFSSPPFPPLQVLTHVITRFRDIPNDEIMTRALFLAAKHAMNVNVNIVYANNSKDGNKDANSNNTSSNNNYISGLMNKNGKCICIRV